jgi:hypothetical protein
LRSKRLKIRRKHKQKDLLDKVDENDIVHALVEIKNDSSALSKTEKSTQRQGSFTLFLKHVRFSSTKTSK